MKEITINIPDESSELVMELVERLGGSVDKKKKITTERVNIKSKPKKNIGQSGKTKKEKIDHTYLFGKWKDFDIDPKKLREESW